MKEYIERAHLLKILGMMIAICGTRMDKENKHKVRCAKCGKIKEMVCTVDGKPWCEDCFDKAMESGTKHETN